MTSVSFRGAIGPRHDGPTPVQLCLPAVVATVPVSIAARVMARRGVDSLVVLEDGRACGVLTALDVVRAATLAGRPASEVSVADVCCRHLAEVMTPEPLLVDAGTAIADAARLMVEAASEAAIVMEGDAVAGVVTGQDIVAVAGLPMDPCHTTVDEVSFKVSPLSVDDDIERAVQLVGVTHGRPVPVVDDADPVGTVRVPLSWRVPD